MPAKLEYKLKPLWEVWDAKTKDAAFDFSEGYKEWLGVSKTERMAVKSTVDLVGKNGFRPLADIKPNPEPGVKIYDVNRGKNIVLAVIGKKSISEGFNAILSHTDSPRLDLKVRPLYEKEKVAFLKTHYYGGIKKYHWFALPLALHGIVVKEDGSIVNVEIGERKEDPVLMITDLLPHLDVKRLEKNLKDAFEAEELNVVTGSLGQRAENGKQKADNNTVKKQILGLLNRKYGITEEDLVSADLALVPAGSPRDLGLDRSLVAAYGQDDKVCAYTSLKALLDLKGVPEKTSVIVFADKEEIGSEGNTSATSMYFYDFFGRLLSLQEGSKAELEGDTKLRSSLAKTKAISADVSAAIDPDYTHAHDTITNPRLGYGIVLEKYTGSRGKACSSEASAEYMAQVRAIFNKANVQWQGGGGIGKVDVGGGGTIAMFLAKYNMDIVDAGPAIWNMHAPWEIASKADIYSAYQAYSAFFHAS